MKRSLKRPILDYVFGELAKYEGRSSEIAAAASDVLADADPAVWLDAVVSLSELLSSFGQLTLQREH